MGHGRQPVHTGSQDSVQAAGFNKSTMVHTHTHSGFACAVAAAHAVAQPRERPVHRDRSTSEAAITQAKLSAETPARGGGAATLASAVPQPLLMQSSAARVANCTHTKQLPGGRLDKRPHIYQYIIRVGAPTRLPPPATINIHGPSPRIVLTHNYMHRRLQHK